MNTAVLHGDVVLWLCRELRRERDLNRPQAPEPFSRVSWVADREEPSGPGPEPGELHVLVALEANVGRDVVQEEATVSVTVLAGDRADRDEAFAVSRWISLLLSKCARVEPGNPVSHVPVESKNGPYLVPGDNDNARCYQNAVLVLSGQPVDLS